MGRFLIYFSYLGTRYSGVQKQLQVSVRGKPVKTVSAALEDALTFLRPSNDIRITLSSRTDKGVHALKNACHVNLDYPSLGQEYNPQVITNVMNYYLKDKGEDIRVLQTRQVPLTFHSRFNACRRHYVYRLGHILNQNASNGLHDPSYDNEAFLEQMKRFAIRKIPHQKLPLGEQLSTLDACKAVVYRSTLDISKLISAAEVISGIHNFLPLSSRRNSKGDYQPHPMKMLTIGVKRGQPFGHQLQMCGVDVAKDIEFWDIHVKSKSFLYKQIRKIVGTMVMVAKNGLSLEELKNILNNPYQDDPIASHNLAKESGLFLLSVDYDPEDLKFVSARNSSSQQQQSSSCGAAVAPPSSAIQKSQDQRNSDSDDTDSEVSSDDGEIRLAVTGDQINSAGLQLASSSKEIGEVS